MSRVVDASIVVAALVDGGADGAWAESRLLEGDLFAPALLPVEAANVLRRAALAGDISEEVASLAHADLLLLRVHYVDYESVGTRTWELRGNLTAYDAWYVATAEALGLPLATLDLRLSRAPGPRCAFETPPANP